MDMARSDPGSWITHKLSYTCGRSLERSARDGSGAVVGVYSNSGMKSLATTTYRRVVCND